MSSELSEAGFCETALQFSSVFAGLKAGGRKYAQESPLEKVKTCGFEKQRGDTFVQEAPATPAVGGLCSRTNTWCRSTEVPPKQPELGFVRTCGQSVKSTPQWGHLAGDVRVLSMLFLKKADGSYVTPHFSPQRRTAVTRKLSFLSGVSCKLPVTSVPQK